VGDGRPARRSALAAGLATASILAVAAGCGASTASPATAADSPRRVEEFCAAVRSFDAAFEALNRADPNARLYLASYPKVQALAGETRRLPPDHGLSRELLTVRGAYEDVASSAPPSVASDMRLLSDRGLSGTRSSADRLTAYVAERCASAVDFSRYDFKGADVSQADAGPPASTRGAT
jgi:hypothetical protein